MYHSVTAMVGAGVSDVASSRKCNRCCLRQSTSITSFLHSRSRQQQPGRTQLGCFPPDASVIDPAGAANSRQHASRQQKQLTKAFIGNTYVFPATARQAKLYPEACWYGVDRHAAGTALTSLVACCSALCCAIRQVLGLPAALTHLGWIGGTIFMVFSFWVRCVRGGVPAVASARAPAAAAVGSHQQPQQQEQHWHVACRSAGGAVAAGGRPAR